MEGLEIGVTRPRQVRYRAALRPDIKTARFILSQKPGKVAAYRGGNSRALRRASTSSSVRRASYIERDSMVRATRVALATTSKSGTINDRSLPVNSIMRTTVEIGPCVLAARTAPHPARRINRGPPRARTTTTHVPALLPAAHPR